MVPFNETVYQSLVNIAERIVATASEKIGYPAKLITLEPLVFGAIHGQNLITYNFETNKIEKEEHHETTRTLYPFGI